MSTARGGVRPLNLLKLGVGLKNRGSSLPVMDPVAWVPFFSSMVTVSFFNFIKNL
jgi:hypothetical protein